MKTFNASGLIYTVNGRRITQWGSTDTPVADSTVDPKRTIVKGQGGHAAVGENAAPGVQHVISVLRGSSDSSFLSGIFAGDGRVTVAYSQLGTLESFASQEGIITDRGDFNSGSGSVTDDTYTIVFNNVIQTRGGS